MVEHDTEFGTAGPSGTESELRNESELRHEPLVCMFMLESFVSTRHRIRAFASKAGLADLPLYNFVLAASEIMTNAIQHGGGAGDLTVWEDHDALYCEVVDRGPGIRDGKRKGHKRPDSDMIRGRGLWLIRQICNQVDIETGATGTTVRIAYRLDPTKRQATKPQATKIQAAEPQATEPRAAELQATEPQATRDR